MPVWTSSISTIDQLDLMTDMTELHNMSSHPSRSKNIKRWLPVVLLACIIVAFFSSGLYQRLTLDELALRYADLNIFLENNFWLAVITSIAAYIVVTATSIPVALILSISIGLVFGWAVGAAIIVVGATLGASIIFFIARSLLFGFFKNRAGKFLNVMAEGFRKNAVSYMLFLRLAAIFPFSVVNVVPAILGVPFPVYFWTTFVGIIPGTIAYAFAGEGLRSIIGERATACANNIAPCGEPLSAADIITTQMLIAFVLLALVSLLPVVLKRFRRA